MSSSVACPQCGQQVDPQARFCEHCGADLAIAAVLAEQRLTEAGQAPGVRKLTPEALVPRLGESLIEMGILTQAELEAALEYQRSKTQAGEAILLGQALRELGLVSAETLDQAITVQILQLQSALREANRRLEARVQERTRELQAALERLGELNQLKANFIANVSHELRTPLAHLRGYLDLLSEGSLGALTPQQTRALEVMRRAQDRLERLIEDLIQFSLATRGELKLEIVPTDLAALIRETAQQAQDKLKRKSIQLKIALPTDLPLVACDPEKIGWVIAHLLDNAVKFTPPQGLIKIEAAKGDASVKISVIDSGIGIPADRIHEIFEPFHQLDGSSTRKYAGTGLGLALSQRILVAHETRFELWSHPGEGSRFEFSLPLADVPVKEEKV